MKEAKRLPLRFPDEKKALTALYLLPAQELEVLRSDHSHAGALLKEGRPWLPREAPFRWGEGQASGRITCIDQPYGLMYDLELYITKDNSQGLTAYLENQPPLAAIAVAPTGHHFLMGWPHGFFWVKEGHDQDLSQKLIFLKLLTTSPPLVVEPQALVYPVDYYPYRNHPWQQSGLPLALIKDYPLSQFQV